MMLKDRLPVRMVQRESVNSQYVFPRAGMNPKISRVAEKKRAVGFGDLASISWVKVPAFVWLRIQMSCTGVG